MASSGVNRLAMAEVQKGANKGSAKRLAEVIKAKGTKKQPKK